MRPALMPASAERLPTGALAGLALLLSAVTLLLRWEPLAPPSLWLDDAWTALVYKADTAREVWLVGVTSRGFAAALKGWFSLVGFSELRAQAIPLASAVATPAILFLALSRHKVGILAGIAAGSFIAFSSTHAVYSVRVKQFTLDGFLAAILIGIGLYLSREPREARRWIVTVTATVIATGASPSVAPVAASALLAGAWTGRHDRSPRRWAALSLMLYGTFSVGWYLLTLRSQTPPELRRFWRNRYVDVDDPLTALVSAWDLLVELMKGFLGLPPVVTLFLWIGAITLLAFRRPTLAIISALPVAVALGAAFLQLAPLGGKRTDIYLYPVLALGLGAALHASFPRRHAARALLVIGAIAGAIMTFDAPGPYPSQAVKPLVERFESTAPPSAGVVVEPTASWAYLLYSKHDVDLVADKTVSLGFHAILRADDVYLLGAVRQDRAFYAPIVQEAKVRHLELWLVTGHKVRTQRRVEGVFRDEGLRRVSRTDTNGAAVLTIWERRS